MSIWSGTQWPPSKGGRSHSIRSMVGRLEVATDTEEAEEAVEVEVEVEAEEVEVEVEVVEVVEVVEEEEEEEEGWTAAETSRS